MTAAKSLIINKNTLLSEEGDGPNPDNQFR